MMYIFLGEEFFWESEHWMKNSGAISVVIDTLPCLCLQILSFTEQLGWLNQRWLHYYWKEHQCRNFAKITLLKRLSFMHNYWWEIHCNRDWVSGNKSSNAKGKPKALPALQHQKNQHFPSCLKPSFPFLSLKEERWCSEWNTAETA